MDTIDAQDSSCIYSFRCSRAVDARLTQLMEAQSLNRSSVIRLALYTLDCYMRRSDVRGLSLEQLLGHIEEMAPECGLSFESFISGR